MAFLRITQWGHAKDSLQKAWGNFGLLCVLCALMPQGKGPAKSCFVAVPDPYSLSTQTRHHTGRLVGEVIKDSAQLSSRAGR